MSDLFSLNFPCLKRIDSRNNTQRKRREAKQSNSLRSKVCLDPSRCKLPFCLFCISELARLARRELTHVYIHMHKTQLVSFATYVYTPRTLNRTRSCWHSRLFPRLFHLHFVLILHCLRLQLKSHAKLGLLHFCSVIHSWTKFLRLGEIEATGSTRSFGRRRLRRMKMESNITPNSRKDVALFEL